VRPIVLIKIWLRDSGEFRNLLPSPSTGVRTHLDMYGGGVGRSQEVAYCADAPRMKAARSLLCWTRLGSWTYIMWPAG
jgi:hypothetical protein